MKMFTGECFGVELLPRDPPNDMLPVFRIMIEDDDMWFEFNGTADTKWLDELIELLQSARDELRPK